MHLYPVSLLITAAVLLPNYGKPHDSVALTIVERAGQISSFVLPLFFSLSFVGTMVVAAWAVLGLSLALYYAGWIRYFSLGRDYALLFKPLIGIPVPMAVSPVLLFLVSSLVLGSVWQAIAAIVLGIGHITITAQEQRRLRRRAPYCPGRDRRTCRM